MLSENGMKKWHVIPAFQENTAQQMELELEQRLSPTVFQQNMSGSYFV